MKISAIFPVYNEIKNISYLIKSIDSVSKKLDIAFQKIFVIHENSTDGSIELLTEYCNNNENNHKCIIQKAGDGRMGTALSIGFMNADFDYIFYMDSDNQFDLNEIRLLIKHILKYDIVAGYRFKRSDPVLRIFTARVYNAIIRTTFNIPYKDVDCAFRLFNKRILRKIKIKSKLGLATSELLIKSQSNNFSIKQIPVTHFDRKYGQSEFQGKRFDLPSVKVVFDLLIDIIELKKSINKQKNQSIKANDNI